MTTRPTGMEFDYVMKAPHLLSHCGFLFVFKYRIHFCCCCCCCSVHKLYLIVCDPVNYRRPEFHASVFLIVQLSQPSMTTGKTITLTICAFVRKVMSLLFNMLSRFVTVFLPRSNYLLISWLQSPP